jgi:hypothetical protein
MEDQQVDLQQDLETISMSFPSWTLMISSDSSLEEETPSLASLTMRMISWEDLALELAKEVTKITNKEEVGNNNSKKEETHSVLMMISLEEAVASAAEDLEVSGAALVDSEVDSARALSLILIILDKVEVVHKILLFHQAHSEVDQVQLRSKLKHLLRTERKSPELKKL